MFTEKETQNFKFTEKRTYMWLYYVVSIDTFLSIHLRVYIAIVIHR